MRKNLLTLGVFVVQVGSQWPIDMLLTHILDKFKLVTQFTAPTPADILTDRWCGLWRQQRFHRVHFLERRCPARNIFRWHSNLLKLNVLALFYKCLGLAHSRKAFVPALRTQALR